MQEWKLRLFVRVVTMRMAEEGKTAEEILSEYPALTEDERQEILTVITS